MATTPVIPEYITVHLGAPDDTSAQNIRVSFPDYIKNVASSEIYPTWPENAIRANIYAQVSYALNRIFTEWYPSRGYNFDITNSTQYDQSFVPGREIFENVGRIVDDLFDDYLTRPGRVEPLFAQYCNGTTTTCEGLSQWGTVPLAEQGLTPYQILTHFYGPDLNIVFDAPVQTLQPSYPGTPLRVGMANNTVRDLQVRLNRISTNYPSIPKIYPVDGLFGTQTERAVREFQRVFNLAQDGIVGKSTWYKIAYLYTTVKRLAELDSEGLTLQEIQQQYPNALSLGMSGTSVQVVQYYLAVISQFMPTVSSPPVNGVFDEQTENAVREFQTARGIPVDGIVGEQTWDALQQAYLGIVRETPELQTPSGLPAYPGRILIRGVSGDDVELVQETLNFIAQTYTEIPTLPVTGYYGDQTIQAVSTFQRLFGLPENGDTGPFTWDALQTVAEDLRTGAMVSPGQFPGYTVREEETQ